MTDKLCLDVACRFSNMHATNRTSVRDIILVVSEGKVALLEEGRSTIFKARMQQWVTMAVKQAIVSTHDHTGVCIGNVGTNDNSDVWRMSSFDSHGKDLYGLEVTTLRSDSRDWWVHHLQYFGEPQKHWVCAVSSAGL